MKRAIRYGKDTINYELVKTLRKSIEIRILSRGEVRVFAPQLARLRDVDAFVASRAQWIEQSILALSQYAEKHASAHPMHTGAEVLFEGVPLLLKVSEAKRAHVQRVEDTLIVQAPDTSEEAVRAVIRDFLFTCAGARITERLGYYTPLVGCIPGRVTIRDQKTRWGSCSSARNLNFNYKLIMAPPEALDYVVVHELCHLYDFNHSPTFWARVKRYQPDYALWKRWLKDNGQILGV